MQGDFAADDARVGRRLTLEDLFEIGGDLQRRSSRPRRRARARPETACSRAGCGGRVEGCSRGAERWPSARYASASATDFLRGLGRVLLLDVGGDSRRNNGAAARCRPKYIAMSASPMRANEAPSGLIAEGCR